MPLRRFLFSVLTGLSTLALVAPANADCPTPRLEQFGFNTLPIRAGVRPLMVTLVDFTDAAPNPARDAAYVRRLVFATTGSVNAMYIAASNGTVYFSNAGVFNVAVPVAGGTMATRYPTAAAYDAEVTQLTAAAMRAVGGRTLESFDRNGDRSIDNSELMWVRISNSSAFRSLGQTRPHSATFGDGYSFSGWTSNVDEEFDINGIAHEVLHAFGNNDHIYGPGFALNTGGSFFAASFAAPGPGPVALDPYNRMRAGWLRPRLVAMNTSSSAGLRHYGDSGNQDTILFYDSVRCGSEFFLVDFRNPNRSTGAAVDRGGIGAGGYVWYVRPAADFSPFQFNWPPPIRGPFRPGAADHAIANYLVGPRGPGSQTNLVSRGSEFLLSWGGGEPTGFGLEATFPTESDVGYIGWRRVPGRFVAQLDAINGAVRPTAPAASDLALTGRFPVRAAGIRAELINLSGRRPLTILRYAPDRVVVRAPAGTPLGAYQVHLIGSTGREIDMRGNLQVTLN